MISPESTGRGRGALAVLSLVLSFAAAAADIPYVKDGLQICYDGALNGDDPAKLVNLGLAGSDFDLAPCVNSADDFVSTNMIHVCKGFGISAPLATPAFYGDHGYTIEYIGRRTGGGDAAAGYYPVFGTANDNTAAMLILGPKTDGTEMWMTAHARQVKVADASADAFVTQTMVVDFDANTISYYTNGVLCTSSVVSKFTADAGVRRVNVGDLRTGRLCNWRGDLGSLRVYNRPLSGADIDLNASIDRVRILGEVPAAGALTVATDTAVAQNCDPAIGLHADLTSAECTASDSFTGDGRCYSCRGYALEYSDDGGVTWTAPVTNLDATTYLYEQSARAVRLTWLWTLAAYRLTIETGTEREGVSFVPAGIRTDPSGSAHVGYFAPGTRVTVTVAGAAEPPVSEFREWRGDLAGVEVSGATAALTVSGARTLEARFLRHWIWEDAGEDAYPKITDGNWVLYVNPSVGRLISNGACKSGAKILDFTTVSSDLAAAGKPFGGFQSGSLGGVASLTEVILPDGFAYGTSDMAFNGCSNLRRVEIAGSLANAGAAMFANCTALATHLAPDAGVVPGKYLKNSSGIADIRFEKAVSSVREEGFYGCSSLTNVVFARGLGEIGKNAFTGCRNPVEIEIGGPAPASVDATFEALAGKAIVRIRARHLASYVADGAVPCAEIADIESKANYGLVKNRKTLYGMWRGNWLVVRTPGLSVLVR